MKNAKCIPYAALYPNFFEQNVPDNIIHDSKKLLEMGVRLEHVKEFQKVLITAKKLMVQLHMKTDNDDNAQESKNKQESQFQVQFMENSNDYLDFSTMFE
ncbi:Hypothetical_protein [Hexamita inflata]|uniref:Hypothetical_protein n=1 Tax=Hexamita inflata TaxID=28002 RepID=A0AA86PH26_9EUKA|nr:Hypothetical protein HINF_LOCUS25811 [Hexamita inflata]